ncbi:ERV2 FAD-linked sulfhydryl oxidase ERV2 [Candida maltosa Xu316]
MKLHNLLGWSLFALPAIVSAESHNHQANIYALDVSTENTPVLSEQDTRKLFNTFVNVDQPYVEIGDSDHLIDFMNDIKEAENLSRHRPKMVVTIKGGDLDSTALFTTNHMSKKFVHKLFKKIVNSRGMGRFQLTPELEYVAAVETQQSKMLVHHFKYFNEKLDSIWKSYTEKHQHSGSGYNPTNDKMFINELSQLIHLYEVSAFSPHDIFLVELSSLASIKRKIGDSSETYKHAEKTLTDLLRQLTNKYEVLVVTFPYAKELPHLNKRTIELSRKSFTYGTKEACEVATNNCNSHGKCTKSSGDSWSCLCEVSFNKTTSKSTTWVGADCAKKDVSVEANLFLWTSIALVFLLVGGINLMFSIGNQPLPGVLDAATVPKKSVFSTIALLGIIGVIYFMSTSSTSPSEITKPLSKISIAKENFIPKFTQQQQQNGNNEQQIQEKPLEEPDVDESLEDEQIVAKDFTETPFMPKMANETLKAQLGNASWRLFHTILARYPDNPTTQERNTLESYIHLFAQVYPCGDCARHFTKLLAKYPPQTSSRKTAALWGCHVHNIVNEKLKKPEYDCTTILEDYDCGCGDDEKENDYTLKGESMEHLRQIKVDEKKDIQQGG